MASIFFDGLMSGLDTTAIIKALMSAEAAPKARLELRQATYDKRVDAWGSISTALSSLRTAGNDLLTPQKFNLFKATSSDTTIATATASSSAAPGSFSFRVAALAASHQVMSQGFASTTSLVGAGTFTVGEGIAQLGLTNVQASSTLTSGAHTLKVVQASGATTSASMTGTAVTVPVTIDPSTRRIDITVNGVARQAQIATGTYNTLSSLATAVQTAIGSDVTVTAVNGALEINTVATGPTASLQVTGGNALAKVGWSVMASPSTGTATSGAVLELDGVQTTINPVAGQSYTINGTTGSLTVTIGSLVVGEATVYAAQTDSTTTLAGLATKLQSAGLSAQALDTGSGTATPANLVVSSSTTGTKNALTVDTGSLSGFTSGFSTLRAAADAQLTLGNGGLTITRSSNTITDVLPGVTLQLTKADATKDVTVVVDHDADAIIDKVKAFVSALNSAIGGMKTHTKAGQVSASGELEEGATAGVLWGDGNARRLQKLLADGMWYTGAGTIDRASDLGIEVERDGTYTLDEAKLREKLASDFDGTVAFLGEDTAAGTDGLFGTMVSIIDTALASDGLIDSATEAAQRQSDDAGDRIAAFDVRLDLMETRYRRQFAAMETLIGRLKNQSNWLASQIAQLPTTNA
ncbi:MAG: flagellar filament capping protein FliD [Actinomycetota bacterium]